MIIQKIEISNPKKETPKLKIKLNHSTSSCNLSLNNNNKMLNLPLLLNDNKIKKDSIIFNYLNEYDLRNFSQNNQNMNKEGLFIKFKPRRLIKIQKGSNDTQIPDFRNLPLNQDKAFSLSQNENNSNSNQNLINFSLLKSKEFFDEDNIRLKKYAFSSKYVIKLEKNIENFEKLKTNHSNITPNKVVIFDELTHKIAKIMKSQKAFFIQSLYEVDENPITNINNGIKIPSTKNSTDTNNANNNEKNIILNNDNINTNIAAILKKEIILCYEYNSLINKLFSFLLDEISSGKSENFKLLQRNHEEELIINSKTKSLNELNKYLNRYDVHTKINYNKKQEEKHQTIKEHFKIKENEYISQIYKLENEIKMLNTILDKNKVYYDKYLEYESKVGMNKKETDQIKRKFKRELKEKDNLFIVEKNKEEDLNDQLDDMKDVVERLKREKNDIRKMDLLDKKVIKKLENKINEQNENIMMINEELEWFINQNDNMKKILNDRESTIKTMEMKLNNENSNINSHSHSSNIIDEDFPQKLKL